MFDGNRILIVASSLSSNKKLHPNQTKLNMEASHRPTGKDVEFLLYLNIRRKCHICSDLFIETVVTRWYKVVNPAISPYFYFLSSKLIFHGICLLLLDSCLDHLTHIHSL